MKVPAFDLSKLGTVQPSTPGVDFGQKAPKVKEQAKVEAKNVKSLPNTGMNSSSTAALGLSLIGLIGLAVRRKLSKQAISVGSLSNSGHGEKQEMKSRQHFAAQIFSYFH